MYLTKKKNFIKNAPNFQNINHPTELSAYLEGMDFVVTGTVTFQIPGKGKNL